MRISDWSSDVCSSDLARRRLVRAEARRRGERRRVFASVSRQRDHETRGCRKAIGRWRGRRCRARTISASPRLCENQFFFLARPRLSPFLFFFTVLQPTLPALLLTSL